MNLIIYNRHIYRYRVLSLKAFKKILEVIKDFINIFTLIK